ncbi:gustatory receptor for sugar taste 43a-like [Phymastichus coffea]|uniref:gustatory receptor for sugar taste 43a-like n=1 Tax=Phymastichus coffea TaxID=108790 RepID=UPI00273B438C|nr:gustatory receptor for sugar taste 43a-like [Phymastichus coffea]
MTRTWLVFLEKISRPKSKNSGVDAKAHQAKSDIFYTLVPIYHISKICGLLPVKFAVNKTGRYSGRLDYPQVGYGVLLVLALAGAQCWGLYRDLRNGWQNSTRLSSETAITVTCSDVFAVISVAVVAILGSSRRWRHLQRGLDKLVDVDEKLGVVTSRKLRQLSVVVISCSLVYLVVISTLDYVSWSVSSATKNNHVYGDKGPVNYCPLYFMYVVIVAFEMQYAIVLFNVGERFLKLNQSIEELTRTNLVVDHFRKDLALAVAEPRREISQSISSFVSSELGHHNRLRRANRLICSDFTEGGGGGGASEAIDQLTTLHGTLCDSVVHVNEAYGAAILAGTISCLIHLIITPYFLYNEIYSPNSSSWYVLILQVFWILFHVYRLLLFVQPCYMVSVKARTTGALVSRALAANCDPQAKKQLEIFSVQLLQRPVEFTACGLFYLDRGLMTSIAGSVTTYLVILVQFQNADDTKGTKHLLQNASELLRNVSSIKNITTVK